MNMTKYRFSFCVVLIVSVVLCFLDNISRSDEPVKNDLLESMELQKVVDNLTKKDLLPAYLVREDAKKLSKFIDTNLQQLDICWHRLTFTKIEDEKSFKGKSPDQIRKDKCEAFLALNKVIHDLTDPKYVAKPMAMNVWPKPDESDETNQSLLPNMPPSDIKNPKTRQKYKEAIWNNTKNILEYRIQRKMSDLKPSVRRVFLEYIRNEYSPQHNTDRELVDLLEKYEYPTEERIKLLCDLNIPYKGFRNWESTDKLFKATAKFISLEKDEINLEKADNKKTTIELAVLRKEDQDYVKQQKDVESIEKTLDKVASQTKDYANAAKSIQDGNVYKKPETIDDVLDIFERQYRTLKNILFYFARLDDVAATKLKPAISAEWLSFRMILNESFDTNHDFSVPVYKNLHAYGYMSGIDPKHIKEPDIRKDYEERLAKNTQLAYERRVQHTLRQLLEDATKEVEKFICNAYERKPRADQELVDLLEKYKYPEIEKIELLCKLNIPYKGFRNWESTDKLFKATAKFISLEKDEINLEKADGKKTTIELAVLRKEDQDFVKKQLEPEKKTVDDEKVKKD